MFAFQKTRFARKTKRSSLVFFVEPSTRLEVRSVFEPWVKSGLGGRSVSEVLAGVLLAWHRGTNLQSSAMWVRPFLFEGTTCLGCFKRSFLEGPPVVCGLTCFCLVSCSSFRSQILNIAGYHPRTQFGVNATVFDPSYKDTLTPRVP